MGRRPTNSATGAAQALILEFADHLLVFYAVTRVVLRLVGEIVFLGMLAHVFVHVLGINLVKQTVNVDVQQLGLLTVDALEVVVPEVIHPVFCEVEDRLPDI
jgi:hypothetical protein